MLTESQLNDIALATRNCRAPYYFHNRVAYSYNSTSGRWCVAGKSARSITTAARAAGVY